MSQALPRWVGSRGHSHRSPGAACTSAQQHLQPLRASEALAAQHHRLRLTSGNMRRAIWLQLLLPVDLVLPVASSTYVCAARLALLDAISPTRSGHGADTIRMPSPLPLAGCQPAQPPCTCSTAVEPASGEGPSLWHTLACWRQQAMPLSFASSKPHPICSRRAQHVQSLCWRRPWPGQLT